MCPHDGDDSIHTDGSFANAAVLVHSHRRFMLQCDEVRTLSQTDHKPIQRCSVHRSQSQMPTVRAMTITVDSLLPRPKLDCDMGYDVAMKSASAVVDDHK